VEVVEDEDDLGLLGELVDEPRQHHLAHGRGRDHRHERLPGEPRAGTAERLDDVRPQHDRVVVALVERHPGDGPAARLVLAPGGEQRRLPEPGRAGDEAEPQAAAVAQPREEPLTRHRLRRHERRVQLRDEQDRSLRTAGVFLRVRDHRQAEPIRLQRPSCDQ
jgi:hypothetical protein